jgi:Fic family protein
MSHWIWQQAAWADFQIDYAGLLPRLGRNHRLLGRLYQQLEYLGLDLGLKTQVEALTMEAVETSAIEGVSQDRQRIHSSLAKRLGLPAGGLPEARERENALVDMLLDATGNIDAAMDEERLCGWHHALFPSGYSGLHRIAVARYRPPERDPMRIVSGAAGRERTHYLAPPADQVPAEMNRFFAWWEATRPGTGGMDFILRSGIVHYWFVAVHPFEDGNGRIARALADLALAQGEGTAKRSYSISAAIMNCRENYYKVLDKTSRGAGDLTEWLDWYLDIHAAALEKSKAAMDQVLWAGRVWRQALARHLNQRQRKVMAKLIEKGAGGFTGGLTRGKYIAMSRTSPATAARDLAEMVGAGLLVPFGSGRASAYQLHPDLSLAPGGEWSQPGHTQDT